MMFVLFINVNSIIMHVIRVQTMNIMKQNRNQDVFAIFLLVT